MQSILSKVNLEKFLDCKYGLEERREAEFLGLDYKKI